MHQSDLKSKPEVQSKLLSALSDAYFPIDITEIGKIPEVSFGMESQNLGQLHISRMKSNVIYCGRRRKDVARKDVFVLHLMEEGSVVFTQHHRSFKAQPGALVLINPDPLLDTEKLSATEAFAIQIPAQLLTMYYPDARNWGLALRGSSFGTGAVLRQYLECCWQQRHSIRPSESVNLSKSLIHLIGATFNKDDVHLTACRSRSMQMHYIRIRDLVMRHLDNEDLSPDFVTSRLGISKSYLFAILKAANTTLRRFVLEQRLERCREMLADPEMSHVSISEIAYSIGFRELPHFSRCFTKRYGESPRAFRTACQMPSEKVH